MAILNRARAAKNIYRGALRDATRGTGRCPRCRQRMPLPSRHASGYCDDCEKLRGRDLYICALPSCWIRKSVKSYGKRPKCGRHGDSMRLYIRG